jgi:hypothetical protein
MVGVDAMVAAVMAEVVTAEDKEVIYKTALCYLLTETVSFILKNKIAEAKINVMPLASDTGILWLVNP